MLSVFSKGISEKELLHWVFFHASSPFCLLLGFLCTLINGYSQHILELTCLSSAKGISYHKLCQKIKGTFISACFGISLPLCTAPNLFLVNWNYHSRFIWRETAKQRNKTSSVFSLQILRQDLLKPQSFPWIRGSCFFPSTKILNKRD